jgi:hypothetical protein
MQQRFAATFSHLKTQGKFKQVAIVRNSLFYGKKFFFPSIKKVLFKGRSFA